MELKNNKRHLFLLVVIGIIALALWTFSLGPALSPGSLASYPPIGIGINAPSGIGYPMPATATPTMT